jgi:hypothetical protein
MAIIEFKEEEKVNPYTQEVADLIAAGEGKASSITVPLADKAKARNLFGKAANAADKTARLKGETITGDAPAEGSEESDTREVTLVFVLTKLNAKAGKVVGPRAKGDESPAETPVETEAAPTPKGK